jgi:hypothetical protein
VVWTRSPLPGTRRGGRHGACYDPGAARSPRPTALITPPVVEYVQNELRDEVEAGFSIRVRQPISFALFELDMAGIAFRAGDDVVGIRLFFGPPY